MVPSVRPGVLQVLEGQGETVVRTLRRLGKERGLSGTKKKARARVCSYLHKNRARRRYAVYLRAG